MGLRASPLCLMRDRDVGARGCGTASTELSYLSVSLAHSSVGRVSGAGHLTSRREESPRRIH